MAILFDLDGVFFIGDKPVTDAVEVARWAGNNGIPHLYLTNSSTRPRSEIVERLSYYGIDADESHILTPSVMAVRWLRKNLPGEKVALFVSEENKVEFSDIKIAQPHENAAAVVIGDLDGGWDFATLNEAFQLLMHEPKPRLIALGMTRYRSTEDVLRLDVAPFAMALSYAASVEPIVAVGKPMPSFYEAAMEILGEPAEQGIMVGNDVQDDIKGAQQAGLKTVAVRTGKFRESDLELGVTPDAVLETVVDFPQWYEENIIGRKFSN